MPRPVNASAERTKHKILQSASAHFAERGFEGTSIRMIAGGAGVSLGMIRHYFGNKEGLYRACIASAYAIYRELAEQIEHGLEGGGVLAEIMAQAARTGFQFAYANRPAFKLTQWTLMESKTWRTDLGDAHMLPFIVGTAQRAAGRLDEPSGSVALRIRSMIFLVVRYATADMDEMAYLLSGGSARHRGTKRTVQAIEDHLADVAVRLFDEPNGP